MDATAISPPGFEAIDSEVSNLFTRLAQGKAHFTEKTAKWFYLLFIKGRSSFTSKQIQEILRDNWRLEPDDVKQIVYTEILSFKRKFPAYRQLASYVYKRKLGLYVARALRDYLLPYIRLSEREELLEDLENDLLVYPEENHWETIDYIWVLIPSQTAKVLSGYERYLIYLTFVEDLSLAGIAKRLKLRHKYELGDDLNRAIGKLRKVWSSAD